MLGGVSVKFILRLYNLDTLIGRYSVDTNKKSLSILYSKQDPWVNTTFTYQRLKEFLEGRMVDSGRVSRKEMLGYSQVPWDVWKEMEITFGYDYDDFLWVSFEGISDSRTIHDFHPRLNKNARSVYVG